MAEIKLSVGNIVFESSTSIGAGDFVLSSLGFYRRFSDSFGTGTENRFYYSIRHQSVFEWEVGIGYMSDADTLVRLYPIEGSDGDGVNVDFSSGTKDVICDNIAQNQKETIIHDFSSSVLTRKLTKSILTDKLGSISATLPSTVEEPLTQELQFSLSVIVGNTVTINQPSGGELWLGSDNVSAISSSKRGSFLTVIGIDDNIFQVVRQQGYWVGTA